jgi:endonuclease YncB( thermonuclease family)
LHFVRYIVLIAVLLFAPVPIAAQTITGVASVTDGDSLEIRGQRIRLHGIDAPESRQLCQRPNGGAWRCGQQASLVLADQIGRRAVSYRVRDTDRYGRAIAVCAQDGRDLNAWMVQQGWAVAYRRYSLDYISAEEEARRNSRNIWSGQFVMPWNWRRAQRGR